MNVTPIERKVLRALSDTYDAHDGCFYGFKTIMRRTKLTRAVVRRACRSLKRKGLSEYGRGLWNDDGEVAGSGYAATKAGVALIGGAA